MKKRFTGFKMTIKRQRDSKTLLSGALLKSHPANKRGVRVLALGASLAAIMIFNPAPAMAAWCTGGMSNSDQLGRINKHITGEADRVMDHVTKEFQNHQLWMIDTYFKEHILPAMQMMAEQLTAVGMLQMGIIGTFFDAKHQLETQRLHQELAARAHKDYHPSEGLCTIGTAMRSLAGASRNADLTAMVLSQRSIRRQLLNANSNATEGPEYEQNGRVEQFRRVYCDSNDNNGNLATICQSSVTQARKNKDIDYSRTIAAPLTLNLDFSNTIGADHGPGGLSPDEEDVLALSANLYAHEVFSPVTRVNLENSPGNQRVYLSARSIVAKRSVAENSFQAIAAMKAKGTTEEAQTGTYLIALMEELGVNATQARELIGANPSYYAQMEILTKGLLQRPDFYIDLYDKPANVTRKGVALQAISLMQERDTFKSNLRSEAMLSVILELQLMREQGRIENEMSRLK